METWQCASIFAKLALQDTTLHEVRSYLPLHFRKRYSSEFRKMWQMKRSCWHLDDIPDISNLSRKSILEKHLYFPNLLVEILSTKKYTVM
jgi:hypothetical protein